SCFFFQAEDGIRDFHVTGVQTCALPISLGIDVNQLPAHPNASQKPVDTQNLTSRPKQYEKFSYPVIGEIRPISPYIVLLEPNTPDLLPLFLLRRANYINEYDKLHTPVRCILFHYSATIAIRS